ncbi:MAG: YceI family protein [bacterium]|jgi:polyisoprenoid-binding protein YceI
MLKKVIALCFFVGLVGSASLVTASSRYEIDSVHSTVGFAVKHMLFSTVRGKFNDVRANLEFDTNTNTINNLQAEILVASVDTDNEDRDAHLRSNDFFDANNHPKMTFKSTAVEELSDNKYRVEGLLTIRNISQPITLEGQLLGSMPGRVAFQAEGQINRQDFDVKWNKPIQQAAGMMVSDEVDLLIEVAMYVPKN